MLNRLAASANLWVTSHCLAACSTCLLGLKDADGKVLWDRATTFRVGNFGIELNCVDECITMANVGILGILGGRDGVEAVRDLGQLAAMGHPAAPILANVLEETGQHGR